MNSSKLLRPGGIQPGVFNQLRDEEEQVLTSVPNFSLETTSASQGTERLLMRHQFFEGIWKLLNQKPDILARQISKNYAEEQKRLSGHIEKTL